MKPSDYTDPADKLRARCAQLLGWSFADACSFSLAMMQTIVREQDAALHDDIATFRAGDGIFVRHP